MQCNLIAAKATGWIFSLFDVVSAREVPFGMLQLVHKYSSWTYWCHQLLICVPFIFADSERHRFGGTCDGLLCVMENIHNFHSGYFDYRSDQAFI